MSISRIFLLFPLLSFALAGCTKEEARPQSAEKEILSFQVNGVDGSIYDGVKTVNLILPAGTDVSALSPVITVSDKATVTPLPGTVQDFSAPVHYTVTAEDGTQQAYIVGAATLPEDAVRTRGPNDVYVWVSAVGGGAVSGGGYVEIGRAMACWAMENPGYKFNYWVASPGGVSYNNPLWVYPTQDTWVTAYFSPLSGYTVTVQSENTSKGTVSGGGYGYRVYVEAIPNAGYVFDGWYLNGTTKIAGLSASGYYLPNSNGTLVAKFIKIMPSLHGPDFVRAGGGATHSYYVSNLDPGMYCEWVVSQHHGTVEDYYSGPEIFLTFPNPAFLEIYCTVYMPDGTLYTMLGMEVLVYN